jgi:Tetratricopeptide repeat
MSILHTNSAKALYRRGYAHAAKKDWDKAEIDLDDAAAITPGDAAIVS